VGEGDSAFLLSDAGMPGSKIAELYSILERVAPSPLHTLNRAVAIAEWQGPDAGLPSYRDWRRRSSQGSIDAPAERTKIDTDGRSS
jgi:predicted RNA polymerase sigma factor